MKRLLLPALVPLLLSTLQAQTIFVSASTLLPLSPEAGVPGVTATDVRPAGSLGPSGSLTPTATIGSGGSAAASLGWSTQVTSTVARFTFGSTLAVDAPAPAFSSTQACDVVVVIQASAPATVNLRALSTRLFGAGGSLAFDRVDVNADGTFELVETGHAEGWYGPFTVGPLQALRVRLRMEATQTGPGTAQLSRTLEIHPENGLSVNRVSFGCDYAEPFEVLPSFVGNGLELRRFAFVDFSVAVLGFDFQPVIVSSLAVPCLLIPSPDILVLVPPTQAVSLPLPAAVRPVAFWAQTISILGPGATPTTNDAYVVAAF